MQYTDLKTDNYWSLKLWLLQGCELFLLMPYASHFIHLCKTFNRNEKVSMVQKSGCADLSR